MRLQTYLTLNWSSQAPETLPENIEIVTHRFGSEECALFRNPQLAFALVVMWPTAKRHLVVGSRLSVKYIAAALLGTELTFTFHLTLNATSYNY